MGKYKDIDDFIKELADWDPHTEFNDLIKIPVQRNRKGEIKNPEVIGIVNIYSDKSIVFEKNEVKYDRDDKKEYVKYIAKKDIEDKSWINNSEHRCKNLQVYLEKMKGHFEKYSNSAPIRLFVGEAPGRRGCYWTGIPFTSEAIIFGVQKSNAFSNYFKDCRFLKITKKIHKENTSKIIWGCFDQLYKKGLNFPLLWNIFPFQPWEYGEICKNGNRNKNNRTPGNIECQVGIKFLIKLLKCFDIKEIYSVGDEAKDTLNSKPALEALEALKKTDEKYKNIELKGHIRHPSHDSDKDFIKQFNEIYQIKTEELDGLDDSEE